MADIFVGCEFPTYRDLQAAADRLSEATGSRLVKAPGTRSAGCHNSLVRAPYLRVDEASLRYSFLNLTCPLAPSCQFGLRAKACHKRQALVIVQLCLAHSGHNSPALSAAGLRAIGSMALREACLCGDLPAVRRLLTGGYPPDAACPATGLAPLHWAAIGCQPGAVRLILDAGAEPGQADSAGLTPRDRARDADTMTLLSEAVAASDRRAQKLCRGVAAAVKAEPPANTATASIEASAVEASAAEDTVLESLILEAQADADTGSSSTSSSTIAQLTMPASATPGDCDSQAGEVEDRGLAAPIADSHLASNDGQQLQQQQQRSISKKRRRNLTPFEIDPARHLTCPRAVRSASGHSPELLAKWRAEAPRLLADRVAAGASGAATAGVASLICCWQCAGALLTGLEAATGANLLVTNSVSIESYVSRHPSSGRLADLLHLKYAQVFVLCDHSPRLGHRRPTRLPRSSLTCPFQLVLRAAPTQHSLYVAAHSSLEHNHPVGRPSDRLSRRVGYSRLGSERLPPSKLEPPPVDVGVHFNLADGDASGSGLADSVANVGVFFDLAGDQQQRRKKIAYPIVPCAPPEMRIIRFMALEFRHCPHSAPAEAPLRPPPLPPPRPPPPPPPRHPSLPPPPPLVPAAVHWSDRAAGFPVLRMFREARSAGGPPVVTAVPGRPVASQLRQPLPPPPPLLSSPPDPPDRPGVLSLLKAQDDQQQQQQSWDSATAADVEGSAATADSPSDMAGSDLSAWIVRLSDA